jgi:hypothetical protein
MALLVEDGSGVTGAESYIDIVFFEAFCSDWGLSLPAAASTSDKEAALRRGSLIFDSLYGSRFAGTPVSSSQGLVFPMTDLLDRRGFELPVLPLQVKQAAAVFARQELNSPMSMFPVVTPGKVKKSVEAGDVSVEYDVASISGMGFTVGSRPILSIVESILSPILSLASGVRPLYGSVTR